MSPSQREEFRLSRLTQMEAASAALLDAITEAIDAGLVGTDFSDYIADPLFDTFVAQYGAEQMSPFALYDTPKKAWDWFYARVKPGLDAVVEASNPRRIADWLGTAIVNGAKLAGSEETGGGGFKQWLSRRDDKVRPFHIEADGQTVRWNEPFVVCGGIGMMFPAQPVGDPECWLNCRCVLGPSDLVNESVTAGAGSGADSAEALAPVVDAPLGVAALADAGSGGDGRRAVAATDVLAVSGHDEVFGTNAQPVVATMVDDTCRPLSMVEEPRDAMSGDLLADLVDPDVPVRLPVALAAGRSGPQPAVVSLGDLGPETVGEGRTDVSHVSMLQHNSADEIAQYADGEEDIMDDTEVMERPADDDTIDVEGVDDDALMEEHPVPWHGVLVPEGVYTGDGRKFAEGALTWRDLPLPLLWQEKSGMGHEGSIIIGQITNITREGNMLIGDGVFADTEEADKVIGLVAEGHLRGVSVDVDQAEMAMESEDSDNMLFSKGRISAATMCSIPAFAEAYISIGLRIVENPTSEISDEPEPLVASPTGPVLAPFVDEPLPFRDYDTAQRKAMIEKGWALPDGSYPIADEEDLRNAIQAIGRASDPAKAKAHIKKRANALGKGDLIPEGWSEDTEALAASATEFKRGPGWVTDPVETKRIHDYWTKPGQEGYAKIGWGTPGDFRRLRAHLAKYVSPRFLNRTTAQWHHDALGYWPGECGRPGNPPCGAKRSVASGETVAAALGLVAAGGWCAPSEWFLDPKFSGPAPIKVTDDGRIYGHLATWGTCHIGIPGTCVEAPMSDSSYAYFRTGVVTTDSGTEMAVGQITMDTGHAPLSAKARAAAAHYDNTGTVVADVAAGEDEFGIWVSGSVRRGLTDDQISALRAGSLSGDWRNIRGNLELVAALVVNVPGFPIPRTGLAASGGHQSALVAAGVVQQSGSESDVEGAVAELVTAVADEVEARASRRARAAALLEDTKALRVASLLTDMEV